VNEVRLAERVARESYGRLLALLAARSRDVASAEDALADAFAAALVAWPRTGAPKSPEAWLFAAAKRKLIDAARRAKTASEGEAEILRSIEEMEAEMGADKGPDHRLGLMFACAHPAIEESVRTPLMLQAVLGFSAERIAQAFLVEPQAMGQRLVRAKKKLRESAIAFEIPGPAAWPQRFSAVLDAIYAAYGAGWSDPLGADPERRDLSEEAIWLGRVLAQQLPEEPEVLGLLSLMLHLEARKPARRDDHGGYVPLAQQNVLAWRAGDIKEAEALLRAASAAHQLGRYQLEAAIQSAHGERALSGHTDWSAIVTLYEGLAELTGSPVARLNAVAALAERDGAAFALAKLTPLTAQFPELVEYQPYWALKADLHAKLAQTDAARTAYDQAIARERDVAVVRFLIDRRAKL
jgi:RNA polymerase sigma-70 factor (ECF subfamily)